MFVVFRRLPFRGGQKLIYLGLSILTIAFFDLPVTAAERIYFIYNSLNLSLQVEALELFAKEGKINQELEFYLRGVSSQDRENFRQALQQTYHFNPVQVYRFFRTPTGETILNNIGNLITIRGGINGKYAIRGALIQAAMDPHGLTILGFLRHFPTDIQLDTRQITKVFKLVETLNQANQTLVTTLAFLAEQETLNEPTVDYKTILDLRKPGPLAYQFQRISLKDSSRQRQFYVDFYSPQKWPPKPAHLIVLSHGLASRPSDYDAIAKHLASHGYVIAIPQHPGSDFQQVQAMLNGYSRKLFLVNEFIDRPLDISYLLDQLEKGKYAEFKGKLNLEKVGAIGHSFGGYTVLALAGGQIDFDNLKKVCHQDWNPNLSLLVQCRALELPQQIYNLKDERIRAIIAVNPMNSALFGQEGLSKINLPVFLVAGSLDPATPLVLEQGQAFTWLTSPAKYLGLVKGQAHLNFSKLDAGTQTLITSFAELTLPEQSLIDKYENALMLAFFSVYLRENEASRLYLQASYADYISQNPFEFYLIDSASESALKEVIKGLNLRFR